MSAPIPPTGKVPGGGFTPPTSGPFAGKPPAAATPAAPKPAPASSPAPSSPAPSSPATSSPAQPSPAGGSVPSPGATPSPAQRAAGPGPRAAAPNPQGAGAQGQGSPAKSSTNPWAGSSQGGAAPSNGPSGETGSSPTKETAAAAAKSALNTAAQASGTGMSVPDTPQNTSFDSERMRKLEQRARMASNVAAQGAAASTGSGAVTSQIAGKAADKAVATGFKIAASASSGIAALVVMLLTGGLVFALQGGGNPLSRFPLPDSPTKQQVEAIPPGWAQLAYEAQQDTKTSKFGIPWTVLAGLLKVQSDFGRAAPYDTVDRDPDRDPKYGPGPGLQGSSGVSVAASDYTGPVYFVGSDFALPVKGLLAGRVSNAVTVDAAPGRTTSAGVSALVAKKGSLPGVVVVDLGATEDVSAGDYGKLVDKAMAAAGESTTVLWFNVHNRAKPQTAKAVNDALSSAKARHANLTILDWAGAADGSAAYVSADKVTPTSQGYAQRARLISDALSSAGSSTGFQMPLKKGTYTLTSAFGYRIHPVTHQPKLHGGLDFGASGGTPIYAAGAGTVIRSGFDSGGFGNLTVIRHDGGIETWYAHQSKIMVKVGDKVTAGQRIGSVGTTGLSTGNHLHFEVHVDGKKQDPAKYLPGGANHATAGGDSDVAFNGTVGGVSLSAAAQCAVAPAKPAIGGTGEQASGPFLLRPEHAAAMRREGLDPNNPCQAANYVAEQLVETGKDMLDEHSEWKDSDDNARKLWGDVIAKANLFADPNTGSAECSVPVSGQLDVSYAVSSIFTCEARRAKALHVVMAAPVVGGKVTFEEISGDDAVDQLVGEALDVSYAFSRHVNDNCDTNKQVTGIFPLTAAVAAKYGATDRCDPQANIRAAARAVLANETTPVSARSAAGGPYAPMVGGWAQMPWALGSDAVALPARGPRQTWESTDSCDAAAKAWLAAAVDAGLPAAVDPLAALKKAPGNPMTSAACKGATEGPFDEQAALLAEAVANSIDPAEADVPTPTPTLSNAPTITLDPKKAQDYRNLAQALHRASDATAPSPAQAGADSLVARLSTTGKVVPAAPRSDGSQATFVFPTASATLDYAINYGGVRPEWDTFGKQVGIVGQVVGDGSAGFAAGGDATTVINAAKKWLGTPYSWGGGGPKGPSKGIDQGANTVGFDCSGLTEYAFAAAGYQIGGVTTVQDTKGVAVKSLAEAQPGDLLFWGSPSHHVAIYLGNNKIIHAPHTGDVVKIANVFNPNQIHVRRVLKPSAGGAMGGTAVPVGAWGGKLPGAGSSYAGLFVAAGTKYGVEPQLMAGLAWQESGYSPDVVTCARRSSVGALGLMQFMPGTARGFGIDPCDPAQAADAGTKYISQLYRQFGSVQLALAAYNAGPGNVKKYGGVPPFAETQHYVVVIVDHCRTLGGRCS